MSLAKEIILKDRLKKGEINSSQMEKELNLMEQIPALEKVTLDKNSHDQMLS